MAAKKPMKTQQAEIPNEVELHALRSKVREAVAATLLVPEGEFPNFDTEAMYADRVIIRDFDGKLWQYSYTVGDDKQITLGERTAVEVDFKPVVQASAAGGDVRIMQALDKEGWQWEVLILQPGLGANRQYFPEDTLRQCSHVFEGSRVFCLDDSQHSKSGDKSAKQMTGWIDQSRYVDGEGAKGRLTLLQSADWLRQNLIDSHAKGKADLYGLSVDAPGQAVTKQIRQAGTDMLVQWFTKISEPATVDVVWSPGTPAGFQRALNAQGAQPEEELQMLSELLKILQAKRPDEYAKIDPNNIKEEEVLRLIGDAMDSSTVPAQQAAPGSGTAPTGAGNAGPKSALTEKEQTQIQQSVQFGWNNQVQQALNESKLPEVMLKKLRTQFFDIPGDMAKVKQAITAEQETLAALTPSGNVSGMGFAKEVAVESHIEQLQQAMDKLFGLDGVEGDVPAFPSIRQAYVRITGDADLVGRPSRFTNEQVSRLAQAALSYTDSGQDKAGYVRISQAQASGSWPLILGNTLARRLVQDYAAVDFGEGRIISNRRRASDFRTLEANRLQYSADLPSVDPEVADYSEAAALGEEGVNYAVSTRGRIMTVTRKTMINDDLGAVAKLPQREGRAARRTFARFVWNLFINNATYDADATAWFHANHNNLGSIAFTADATGIATLVAALQRLALQTEPGSGERLGGSWRSMRPLLVIPSELESKAIQLNQSNGVPGAANNGDNPVYALFGPPENPDRIFVNPLMTDANDWGVFRNPADVDIVEVAFLNGQEQPEVLLADQPTVGQAFLADKIQYKIRHEYGGEVLDFRGADKSVVA